MRALRISALALTFLLCAAAFAGDAPSVLRDVHVWDAERTAAEPADVVCQNGRITALVPPRTAEGDIVFDGEGKTLLMPGLVNAHTHAAMTLLRGLGDGLPLSEWLTKAIFPVEAKLTPAHIRAGTELAMLEMLAGGATAFADMYFAMDEVADAVDKAGLRAALSASIVGFDEKTIAQGIAMAAAYAGHDRITVQLAPHAPYTVPKDSLTKIAAVARENNLGIHFHWLETKSELDMFRDDWKQSPADYLEETGILEAKELLLAHAVWFLPEEYAPAARKNVTVVHNPGSNLKLGSGIMQAQAMLDAGVRVALGTDGAASNNRLDMWQAMREAALAPKGVFRDPTTVSARDVLRMATVSGAEALGYGDLGLIRPGYRADMILVNLDQPQYVGWTAETIPEFVVYSGAAGDVRGTMVAGKMLYLDGAYTTLDRDDIMERAAAARRELVP